VIVGPNGVGKSTLVKLLTRLFEPTSGTVLVDGQDAKSYRLKDLREASAVLSQEHQVLGGVSVAEGVGLGRWQHKDDRALVDEALRLGGAQGLVRKLAKGSDTILRPAQTKMEMGVRPGHDLWPIYEQLEKEAEVSGASVATTILLLLTCLGLQVAKSSGSSREWSEERRKPLADVSLHSARTFMRINTSAVRMVVVDEPSSAMDPAGEYELFKRLREARSGKTMIFITHRFGHLTKHADMILCMKDGRLVEQGTHAELVAKKGEYYDLYNVQAQAFTTPGDA
jgi:ABC-type multidrug transport system fused ATPase/permease subunit